MNQILHPTNIVTIIELIHSEFLSHKEAKSVEITLCSTKQRAKEITKTIANTEFHFSLVCNHLSCCWHSENLSSNATKLIDLDDAICLKTDILILDSFPKIIDQEFARDINASFLIELTPVITLRARKRIASLGRCLIAHTFFDSIQKNSAVLRQWETLKSWANDRQIPLALALSRFP